MIGRTTAPALPDGWQVVRLGDVARVETGGTPSRSQEAYWHGQIPWMASGEINQRRVESTAERITQEGLRNSNARLFPVGTVMVAMNGQGATRGRAAVLGIESTCNQSLAAVSGRHSDSRFLFHVLDSSYEELRGLTGGGRNGLNLGLIKGFRLALPPLAEQRAIAAVLDAMDQAIERTEEVIAATERLRDALLHELLTRGVPGRHSEWTDVPGLGTVPASWDVVRLGEVCEVTSGFAMGPKRAPRDHPRPYLTVANVHTDHVTVDEVRYMELTDAEYASRSLRAGDVVMVEGHAQVSQLGRAAIVPPAAGGFTFQNHLFRVRLLGGGDLGFVSAFINGPRGRAYFASFAGTTSGLNTVSARNVRLLHVPWPSSSEQQAIAAALDSVDGAIERAREERARLHSLQASVADALLTGRLRVNSVATER